MRNPELLSLLPLQCTLVRGWAEKMPPSSFIASSLHASMPPSWVYCLDMYDPAHTPERKYRIYNALCCLVEMLALVFADLSPDHSYMKECIIFAFFFAPHSHTHKDKCHATLMCSLCALIL